MGEPNTLSHCADHDTHDRDNHRVVLLSPLVFQVHAMYAMLIQGLDKGILWDIWECLATHKVTK